NCVKSVKSQVMQNDPSTPDATYVVLPEDGINLIYANPIAGPINIYLGNGESHIFQSERSITIKDVSLAYSDFVLSSYNVNVLVIVELEDMGPRIARYDNGTIRVTPNGRYVINSSGGAVTYNYFTQANALPGLAPV